MKAIVAKLSASGKSACVMLTTSEHSMNRIPVYVVNTSNYQPKQVIDFPDTLKVVPWTGHTTKDGIQLMTLSA